MMRTFFYYRLLKVLSLFLISSIIKAQDLSLSFNNNIDGIPIGLIKSKYSNSIKQDFIVTKIIYYISNITLYDLKGSKYSVDSSFLIDESKPDSKKFLLNHIPSGSYQSIEFIIGVDSLHNCSGAQEGSLDPLNGMFWTWNSGYIFFKLEGKSSYSNLPDNLIEYHIGGYKEPHNNIRKINLPLDTKKSNSILINVDIEKLFSSETGIDFTTLPSITSPPTSQLIADVLSGIFMVEKQE